MQAEQAQSISLLFEAGNQLSQTLDTEQIYMTLYGLLSQAMDCDELIVSGYSSQTQSITCEFYHSWAKKVEKTSFPPVSIKQDDDNPLTFVLLSGQSRMIPNYQLYLQNHDFPFGAEDCPTIGVVEKDLEQLVVRSAIMIPIKLAGEVVGIVQIFSYRFNAFSEHEFQLAEALTTQMAVARNNAFLYTRAAEELRQRSILQQQIEEERNQLELRVQERTEELQQALRVRDHFLANLSHELRTPLTSILGMSELLQYQIHGTLTDKQKRYVELIYNNSEHLMHLFSDLLDMSRFATGDVKLYKEWVPLDSIVESCLNYARSRAEEKQIKVFVENHTDIDRVFIDPQRTKQTLNNILNNAVKFTTKRLAIGFEIMLSSDHEYLEFLIWDQGIGIRPEEESQLMESFMQGKDALELNLGGAGIGLTLAKLLTEMQGGNISIESQYGHGTLVRVRLPFTNPMEHDKPVLPRRENYSDDMVTSLGGKKIVIADADDGLCELLVNYLDIFEVETTTVNSAQQLATILQQEIPDLLLIDLNLPGTEDMKQFLYYLNKDRRFSEMPVFVTCAVHRMPDTQEIAMLKMNRFVRKPFSFTDLGTNIREVLS